MFNRNFVTATHINMSQLTDKNMEKLFSIQIAEFKAIALPFHSIKTGNYIIQSQIEMDHLLIRHENSFPVLRAL